ncbi:hypothetical protein, partial [Hungatella hathewayi]|uniref:hypothetical protein n=1 Tax=Hungatella hathewayi TaxID=154046 RepID=UPI0005877E05
LIEARNLPAFSLPCSKCKEPLLKLEPKGLNSTAFAIGKGFGTIIGGASFDMAKKYTLENAPWYLYGVLVGTAMIGFMLYKNFGTPKDETEKQKQ